MSQLILEGVSDYCPSYRVEVVQYLADFRREWQKMVGGKSLVEAEALFACCLPISQIGLNSTRKNDM
jgi:hypothetical protein